MADHSLSQIPAGARANKVNVAPARKDGRHALRIALDALSRSGQPGMDFVDQPTFLLLADRMQDGVIEVDLCARLLPDAPDYARGFIGLAYRVQDDLLAYESLYLRPTNGLSHTPGAPRDQRAVQYYAFPDWPFDRLRETDPGRFEAAANVTLDHWHRLRVDFHGDRFDALVDGQQVLAGAGKLNPTEGRIGLWVDIGTEGFFANLSVTPRA